MIRNHSRHGSRFPITLGAGGGYSVTKSLRFRSSASAYLNRTPATATNRTTWTWSGWVKRGTLGVQNPLFFAGTAPTDYTLVMLTTGDGLALTQNNAGVWTGGITSSALFRDPAAWYHIVAVWNSTSATATLTGTTADRMQLWVNGVQLNSFSSSLALPQNTNSFINSNIAHYHALYPDASPTRFDGELAEINFIDGRAVPIAELGAFSTYNQWLPKKYAGTYGTNGFYLPFTNTASTTTLVADSSGNANNWTPNNISLTAGSTYDSLTDVPTLTSTTVANYAVLNPLDKTSAGVITNGNLTLAASSTAYGTTTGTIKIPSTGKWYFEAFATNIGPETGSPGRYDNLKLGIFGSDGTYNIDATDSAAARNFSINIPGTPFSPAGLGGSATGDVMMVAYDAATGKLWLGAKGSWSGGGSPSAGTTPTTTTAGTIGSYFPWASIYEVSIISINFGQQPFTYTPPSGFLPLNAFNITAGTVTTSGTFTGNASTDGPMVWLNGTPTAMTINGNAVVFGTQADKLANGFKVRSSSASYNTAGSNTYVATTVGAVFKYEDAQGNP